MTEDDLSTSELAAVTALRRIARKWPRTLTLASIDGELVVLPTGRYLDPTNGVSEDAVIASIPGIPNTGGAW